MSNYKFINIDNYNKSNVEEIYNNEINVQDKSREEIKRFIHSFMIGFYDGAEITIEEEASVYNLLKSIAESKTYYHPITTMPMSEETKKKISKSCKGKKRSEETKERMRQNSRRINVYQYNKNTGEFVAVWASTHEVAEENNYNQSFISKACRGVVPSAYGYIWSYKPLGGEDIKLRITIKKNIKGNTKERPITLQHTVINQSNNSLFC